MMPITHERFEQGMTYAAYKDQMTRNRERLEANEQTVALAAEDLAFFAQLAQPLHVLGIVEDWCGDVIANLPVLAQLAAKSGKIELRLFLRDQNLDLIDQYLNHGEHRSIPVFVFFDHDFRELGHWIERPAAMTTLQSQMLADLFANDPAMQGVAPGTSPAQMPEAARTRLGEAFGTFREQQRAASDRAVIHDFRDLVARGMTSKTPAGA